MAIKQFIIVLAGNATQFFDYRRKYMEEGGDGRFLIYPATEQSVHEKTMGIEIKEIRIIGSFFGRCDSQEILSAIRYKNLSPQFVCPR